MTIPKGAMPRPSPWLQVVLSCEYEDSWETSHTQEKTAFMWEKTDIPQQDNHLPEEETGVQGQEDFPPGPEQLYLWRTTRSGIYHSYITTRSLLLVLLVPEHYLRFKQAHWHSQNFELVRLRQKWILNWHSGLKKQLFILPKSYFQALLKRNFELSYILSRYSLWPNSKTES